MKKEKKLIIVGDSAFAEVAFEYFQYDSEYEVVAFSVEKKYLKINVKYSLPVVPLEEIEKEFNPNKYYFFAALAYRELNRLRTRLYMKMKSKGFKPASYISKNAFIWKNVKIGEHCFIFENNVIQPFVKIGNNVIIWSGNHIGHHSMIEDNCFISSHVVISGFARVKKNCFLGVNSTVADRVVIEEDCFIGPGSVINKNTQKSQVITAPRSQISKVSSLKLFKVKENEMD